jgi:hypothetical protein
MAIDRSAPSEIMAFLQEREGDDNFMPYGYLSAAFLQRGTFVYAFPPGPMDAEEERAFVDLMMARRSEWEVQAVPELMRLRDYLAFLQFAKDEDVVVTVRGANPASGQYIRNKQFHCYDGDLFVKTRRSSPNEGLIAADPQDTDLQASFAKYSHPISYSQYVSMLSRRGYRVLGPGEGYVIEDADGRRFYDGYRLHGVYDGSSHESAWTARRGEALRGKLNRLLGAELVRVGPHDDWEHRNERNMAGPLWGPQTPAIEFMPNQQIRNYLDVRGMARSWLHRRHWERLYPNHPYEAQPKEDDR